MITEHLGEVDLKVSDLAPFGGPATRCGVMLEVLGGAWKKSGRRWREAGRPVVEVFVAPVLAGAPAVPVRIHAQNKLGALRIHLVSAERLAEAMSGVTQEIQYFHFETDDSMVLAQAKAAHID